MSLSLKALGEDPWTGVAERFVPETVVRGAVTHITDYGAFVHLDEGVEGLVHISQLSDAHVRRVSDVLEPGQVVQVRVLALDMERRRISLSMKGIPGGNEESTNPAETTTPEPPAKERKRKRPLRGGLSH